MKPLFLLLTVLFFSTLLIAQESDTSRKIFLVTIDGFRWQELFNGADPLLLGDTAVVQDTTINKYLYDENSPSERRKKLLPFFWNVIAKQGQLYGNRSYGNYADVRNRFKISYPGYNEILSGYPDPLLIPNLRINNWNITILESLNKSPQFNGKVVAFTSWSIFPKIINTMRSGIPVNAGYNGHDGEDVDSAMQLIRETENHVVGKTNTRYDQLTWLNAREYIGQHHPKIAFIGFGETDEFAHEKRYDLYLQHANWIDRMIAELWYYVQTDPFYKNRTTLVITTDHGRGKTNDNWYRHGPLTAGSGNTWLALLGNGIEAAGEIKTGDQIFQNQIAATIAMLVGEKFQSHHRTGKEIRLPPVTTPVSGLVPISTVFALSHN